MLYRISYLAHYASAEPHGYALKCNRPALSDDPRPLLPPPFFSLFFFSTPVALFSPFRGSGKSFPESDEGDRHRRLLFPSAPAPHSLANNFSASAHATSSLICLIDNAPRGYRRARVTAASPGYIGHGHNDDRAVNNSSDDAYIRVYTLIYVRRSGEVRRGHERRDVPGRRVAVFLGRNAPTIDMPCALYTLSFARKEIRCPSRRERT